MAGQWISINATDNSGIFRAYLTLPESGFGPGLVLAQEIFGVNNTMQKTADAYAKEGHVVLVPDLFWRQEPDVQLDYSPEGRQKGVTLYQNFNEAKGVEDIQTSINTLRAREETQNHGIGVVGFCLGGKLAYLAACRTDVEVAIAYYGVGIEKSLDEAKNINCRLVLHVAELDHHSQESIRTQIWTALANKNNIELYLYRSVDHAFARLNGEHYNNQAAIVAHQRSLLALKKEIGPNYNLFTNSKS